MVSAWASSAVGRERRLWHRGSLYLYLLYLYVRSSSLARPNTDEPT